MMNETIGIVTDRQTPKKVIQPKEKSLPKDTPMTINKILTKKLLNLLSEDDSI